MAIRDLLSPSRWKRPRHAAPEGQRWYAIGDVHGCYDLLNALIRAIDSDDEQRGVADTRLLFLGDYIDRGPNSRGVIELMMKLESAEPTALLLSNAPQLRVALASGWKK